MRWLAIVLLIGASANLGSSLPVLTASNATDDLKLLIATRNELLAVPLADLSNRTVFSSQPARAVAFDSKKNKVIWAEGAVGNEDSNVIKRANIDGSGIEDLTTEGALISSIAVDPVTGNIYYYNYTFSELTVCDSDLKNCSVLQVTSVERSVYGIALDPLEGALYWSVSRGSDHWISKAGLDGSNETRLRVGFPGTIAVDASDRRIYFTEFREVLSTDLNGGDLRTLRSCPAFFECNWNGLAINGDVVYVGSKSGTSSGIVQAYNKLNGTFLGGLSTTTTIRDVAVFGSTDDVRLQVNTRQNDCEAAPCSHLCVLAKESFKCLCPPNMILSADQRSCHSHLA